MKTTFEDYKKAILNKYIKEKEGQNSNYLLEPTPGNLKKLALEFAEQKLSERDNLILESFFLLNKNGTLALQIKNFDTEKLKPLCSFLKSKTNLKDFASANLLALFVNLENRPFLKFKGIEYVDKEGDVEKGELKKKNTTDEKIFQKSKNIPVSVILFGLLLFVGVSAFAIKNYTQKKCMVWREDHYEKIACDENEDFISPLNEDVLKNLKKIKVFDTTQFFDGNRPIVWYIKENHKCEFFSSPGLHPVSGKTLKQITPHIIKVHILDK